MSELSLVGALLIGFLGSAHCFGMCGGLAAATGHGASGFGRLLSYNAGRLLSYGLIGAFAGLLGEQLLRLGPQFAVALRTAAGLLLVAMGLYISQWWMGLTQLEKAGARLWGYVQPLTRKLLPIKYHRQAVVLGLLWGLLPCGLVYSTLSMALATANWQQSALFMLAFGVGTLPAMLGMGLLNESLLGRLRDGKFRVVAGVFIIAMGIWTIIFPLQHSGHSGHGGAAEEHQALPGQQDMGSEHHH